METIKIISAIILMAISFNLKADDSSEREYLTALIPNLSVNSLDSYSDFGKYAYSYAPTIGIDVEFSKSRQWKFIGKLNYCPVPYWIPVEIGIGAKDIKEFRSLSNMLYYVGVGLNYKMFFYNGEKGIYGGVRPYKSFPSYRYELSRGHFSQTLGAEVYYGVNYLTGKNYFYDLRFGYRAFLPHLNSDFEFIEIHNIPLWEALEFKNDYLNPMNFFIKLGFGINLSKENLD